MQAGTTQTKTNQVEKTNRLDSFASRGFVARLQQLAAVPSAPSSSLENFRGLLCKNGDGL